MEPRNYILDRIEGEFIVAELPDGSFGNLPCVFAPSAKSGDIIDINVDKSATRRRSEEIKERMNRLFEN